jgi:hypothetical protein
MNPKEAGLLQGRAGIEKARGDDGFVPETPAAGWPVISVQWAKGRSDFGEIEFSHLELQAIAMLTDSTREPEANP